MTHRDLPSSHHVIFLDVDGTYAHHGAVPEAHVAAVRAARRAGNLVLLCTGRPMSLLSPHLTEAGFDGYVAGAGAYTVINGEVLIDTRFPEEVATRTIEALDANGTLYLLEAPDTVYARPDAIAALGTYLPGARADGERQGRRDIVSAISPTEDLSGLSFSKVSTFHADIPLSEIAAAIGPEVAAISSSIPDLGPGAGELFLANVHKAVGMVAVVEHLGLTRDRVVAFGDGPNDLEMLEYAGVGVAIEGSDPALLALADHVAATPLRDGLATAFAELGLI